MVKSEVKKSSRFSFKRSSSAKSFKKTSGKTIRKNTLTSESTPADKKIGNVIVVPKNKAVEPKSKEVEPNNKATEPNNKATEPNNKEELEKAVFPNNLQSSVSLTSGNLEEIIEEGSKEVSDTDSLTNVQTDATSEFSSSFSRKNEQISEENIFDAGNRYFEEGCYPEAKKSYKEALKHTAKHDIRARLWLAMGDVSLKQMDNENLPEKEKIIFRKNIVDNYTIAMALMLDNDEVLNTQAKLGNILYNLGDREGAEEHYVLALPHSKEINKITSAQMLYNYAMMKFHKEDFGEAQIYFNEFLYCDKTYDDLHLSITNFDIAYYLGRTAFQSGNYDLVINLYSSFLDQYRNDNPEPGEYDLGKIHLMLAESYEKSEKCENIHLALDHYTSFLELKDPLLNTKLHSNEYLEDRVEGEMVTVFARIGHLSFRANNFTVAGNCLKEAYYAMKSFTIKNDLILFRLLEKSYLSYTKANDEDNRIIILEEITSLFENMEDIDNPIISGDKIADYFEALGNLYKKMDRNHSAFERFTKCFEVRKRYLGPRDPKLEKLQCKVSTYLYNEGRYNEALNVCENIAYGSDNVVISRKALCIIGKIRAKQRKEKSCISVFEDALGLAKLTGENSLDVADTYELYGQANFQLERFDESIDCFHSAYKIRVISKLTTSEECLNLVRGMVDGYKMIRKYKLALIACSKILATQQDIQVSDIEIASTKEIMADLHCIVGDTNSYTNALELYRESSEILKEKKGTSNESLLMIYVKMGRILGLKLNEYDKSLELFHVVRKSYTYDERGIKPLCALRSLEGEGDVLFHKNDYSSALYKFISIHDYIDIVKPKVKDNDTLRLLFDDCKLDLLHKIGCVHRKTGDYDAALDYLGRGLNMSVQLNVSPDRQENVRTSRFFYEIGLVHKQMKERRAALENLSEAGEILERIPYLDSKGVTLSEDIDEQLLRTKGMGCWAPCSCSE